MCNGNKFYVCEHCGNLVGMINSSGVPMICCGAKMKLIEPGTVEASREKHLPVIEKLDRTIRVSVGSIEHPMTEEHSILWIYLETTRGGQRKCLTPSDAPVLEFALAEGEEAVAAYAYCNLHGLWKTEIN